jgi:two-component system, OmpR family, response regulator
LALRIYLVEDNLLIRENLTATLTEMVATEFVGCAEGEREAIDWLGRNADEWDLAIVDLFLKQGNGLGVVGACRSRPPGKKLVVLTNYATPAVRDRCLALGADAVFDKSNDIEKLVEFCVEYSGS